MNFADLLLFSRIVELGSLSAAGRDLRRSSAVMSAGLKRLESRLGTRLLNRTTRKVWLTSEGETFYAHCQNVLEAFDALQASVDENRAMPRGTVRITAPVSFGRRHVAPHIPEFVETYPEVQLQLMLSDRFADLTDERIDIAIRAAEIADTGAIVRKLTEDHRVICGSPAYLKKHGTPEKPQDLLDHNCLLLRFPGSRQFRWVLAGPKGPITLAVSGNMDSDNSDVIRDWCLAGYGLALKSLWEVDEDLRDGRLVSVLSDNRPVSHGVFALFRYPRFLPPRIRAFLDFIAAKIPSPPT